MVSLGYTYLIIRHREVECYTISYYGFKLFRISKTRDINVQSQLDIS